MRCRRSGLACGFLDYFRTSSIRSSAHCLDFDPIWYGGFYVGEANIKFNIAVNVTTSPSGSNATGAAHAASEALALSPASPVALSASAGLLAKLAGDLASYSQMPVLT